MNEISPLARLTAIAEIEMLKARYFRCVDARDWDGLLNTVLMPDFKLETRDANTHTSTWTARAPFIDRVISIMDGCISIHHGHTPEIDILSSTSARGIWAFHDALHWVNGGPYPNRPRHRIGWGHYHDTYTKTEQGWRIATFRITRLKLEFAA